MIQSTEDRIAEIESRIGERWIPHTNTVRPSHCDVCGLRWPCDHEYGREALVDRAWLLAELKETQRILEEEQKTRRLAIDALTAATAYGSGLAATIRDLKTKSYVAKALKED